MPLTEVNFGMLMMNMEEIIKKYLTVSSLCRDEFNNEDILF